jgi:hypothetical protein
MMDAMKPHAEMHEGPEAFERLRIAMKKILTVPKSALPPSPYKQHVVKKKKPAAPKG